LSYTLAGADSTIAEFQKDIFSYTVYIAPETMSVPQLVFTVADARAKAQMIRTPLHTNDTAIVRVTAENQIDFADYTVIFSRIKSPNNRLRSLSYNGIPLANFLPNMLNYSVILPWEETQIPDITASPQWDSAKIDITPFPLFGTAQIQVTPENGQLAGWYTIEFKRGSNATLQDLSYSLNGDTYPIDNFNADDTAYHVLLPIGTTMLPTLNYVLVDTHRNTTGTVTNVTKPNGIAKVEINGWDHLNKKTYTVEFEVELSTEALLSDLQVDGITIDGFHPDTLAYFVEYEYGTTALPNVTAIATQPDARIEYTQINEYPGVATIKVYAGDTFVQQVYTIAFSVEAGDNAFLSDLMVDSVSLQGFDKNTLFYNVLLPYGTTTLPVVTATAEDERATVIVTQIAQFKDTAQIQVVAINGDINEYRIYFTVDGNSNAYASKLFIDGVSLESFKQSTRNYNYTLPANYSGIPAVTIELQDPNATYIITDAAQIPGQTVVEITAENNIDKFSYRINFTKATVSISSFENHMATVSIYPNPSSDNINFVLKGTSETSSLEISTVEGKILDRYILQEGITPIKIDHLQKGVYFYKVYTERGVLGTGKFIKQ
jgi:hypothetical protein